jgi:hypothetical protein
LQPYAKRENRGRGWGETCRGVWKREEPERQKRRREIAGLAHSTLSAAFSQRIHCNFDGEGYRGYFTVAVFKQDFQARKLNALSLLFSTVQ